MPRFAAPALKPSQYVSSQRARVGTQLLLVAVETSHEPERAHRAIDGAREATLAEHRQQLAARGREDEMHLDESIGRVHVAARPRRLGDVLRVDGRVAERVALDAYLSPRSGQLHRAAL